MTYLENGLTSIGVRKKIESLLLKRPLFNRVSKV